MLFYSYSEFYDTIRVSLLYAFCCAFASFVVGWGIASLLNKDIKCRVLFRAVLLIPWTYSFYQRMLHLDERIAKIRAQDAKEVSPGAAVCARRGGLPRDQPAGDFYAGHGVQACERDARKHPPVSEPAFAGQVSKVAQKTSFPQSIGNKLVVALFVAAFCVLFAAKAGFALSKARGT